MAARRPVASLEPQQMARLQADWKAGLLPPRTIAVKFGVDVDDLRIYAAEHDWEASELTREIAKSHQRAVIQRTVADHDRAQGNTAPQLIDNKRLVEQFGQILAGVTQEQQREISSARRYVTRLMNELERLEPPQVDQAAADGVAQLVAAENPELAKQIRGIAGGMDSKERMKDIEQRAAIVLKLAQAIKLMIETERLVWGMGKVGNTQANDYDALLDELIEISQRQTRIN